MISQFELENKLDSKLGKYTGSQLDQLYLRFFNTDDGLLVLKDLANRCYVDAPLSGGGWSQESLMMNEGMRCVYLSIMTRMRNAVTKGR